MSFFPEQAIIVYRLIHQVIAAGQQLIDALPRLLCIHGAVTLDQLKLVAHHPYLLLGTTQATDFKFPPCSCRDFSLASTYDVQPLIHAYRSVQFLRSAAFGQLQKICNRKIVKLIRLLAQKFIFDPAPDSSPYRRPTLCHAVGWQ